MLRENRGQSPVFCSNGGTAPTRPDSAPASSDTILVSTVEYDDRGRSFKTIDPAGSESRQFFDDAGRTTKSIQNYTDSGHLSKEYQEHEGSKDASTLHVQYNRDTSSSGGEYTKGLRPASVRYPNGRLVHTTYGAADSTADAINRLDAIKDDSAGSPGNSLAEYSYLGAATIVKEDFVEPDVRLDYATGAGDDRYDGFDRFGRVVDQLWYDYGASTDRDRYTYGYDRASNRLYRENTIPSSSSSSSPSGPFPSPGSHADAGNVTGDTILTQVETTYDASGAATFTTSRQRFHDATGTGELTTPGGSQPKARVSYAASWHDAAGRHSATANYGTNGGTAPTRPDSAPASSDTILVSTVEYDDRGQSFKTIDPAGSENRQVFDDAGRTTKTIQNYTDGDPTTGGADEDVTVETTYGSDGQVLTLTAKNSTTGDQTMTYVYGTTLTDSDVARADLLRAEIYPDSDDVADPLGDGADGVYDRVEYTYKRLGQPTSVKDQNGSVHTYSFDALGRPTSDAVTTLAAGVDGAVRRISKSHEVRGMVDTITSHDASSGGNVVNQSVFAFNDAQLLTKEYQEHAGAKDGSTPYVGYNYDTSVSGGEYTKGLRPSSVRYPNGRLVHTTYGASDSTADAINRLDAINADSGGSPGNSLAEYSYLGGGRIVKEDFVEPDVRLDYAAGVGDDPHDGFDRFGRVVDQLWYDYGAAANRDQITHGYDRACNRLYRENTITSAKDEFYTYDGMSQLATFDRGDLNAGKTAISGTPVREEDWTLDPVGNWTDFVQKTSGSTDLDQDRTQNAVNEITDITETIGTAWITPVHDKNGAMTTVPKPSSLANGLTCKYDAWNRLAEVKDSATVVAVYEYDGQNRRVKKHLDTQSPGSPDGIDAYEHFFYNLAWQILETRQTTTESDQPEALQPKYQHVWSARYIDAPILRDENTDVDDLCDDERLYYLTDANFNVTTLIDTAGDAIERYLYDPYGKATIYDGSWSSTRSRSSYNNPTLYTGREYDAETGLYHYRNRYYSVELGRFISRDPIGFEANDANLYRYVGNRVLQRVDYSGLEDLTPGGDPGYMGIGYMGEQIRCCQRKQRAQQKKDQALLDKYRSIMREMVRVGDIVHLDGIEKLGERLGENYYPGFSDFTKTNVNFMFGGHHTEPDGESTLVAQGSGDRQAVWPVNWGWRLGPAIEYAE